MLQKVSWADLQGQPGFNSWAGAAVKAWELRAGSPHSSHRTMTRAYGPWQPEPGVTSGALKHLLAQSLYRNWGQYPAAAGPALLWVQASAAILEMWGSASPFLKQPPPSACICPHRPVCFPVCGGMAPLKQRELDIWSEPLQHFHIFSTQWGKVRWKLLHLGNPS